MLNQARGSYRTAAKEQDSSFLKYERVRTQAPQDLDKATKEWNDVMVDKVEKKNEYILDLASLNAHKKRYYFTDMPILMDVSDTSRELPPPHLLPFSSHLLLFFSSFPLSSTAHANPERAHYPEGQGDYGRLRRL